MRVLLVEDHAKLAMTIASGLRQAGMAVDVVFDGHDALAHLDINTYDVVVLDRDIPRRARRRRMQGDRRRRFPQPGADADRGGGGRRPSRGSRYRSRRLPAQPCDFSELVARVRALSRRPATSVPPTLEHGDLTLDASHRVATRAGHPLALNPKEFAVLELLLASQGAVVPAEEILERVWDEAADPFSQAVRTTMSRLRAKLGDPPIIETVAKAGYRIGA